MRPYLVVLALLLGALLLSVAVGAVYIPPLTVLRILLGQAPGLAPAVDWPESYMAIIFSVRLPRTLLIALTGASLCGSGAAYQGLFRNPLADPYLIGVASGAGLGAVLFMAVRWPTELLGFYAIPAAAFLGALLTVALVYQLARVGRTTPATTLILSGVAVGSFATSLTSFLMLRSQSELSRAIAWMMGGGGVGGWNPVLALLPYTALGLGWLVLSGHTLNVLQFGEEQAEQLGLNVNRARAAIVLAASLSTAAAVSFTGIIGFIGLIVPHLARFFGGNDYRRIVPLSILGGSALLLLADLLARTVLAPQVLPVGIVTALAGAPFFLWVLRRAKSEAYW